MFRLFPARHSSTIHLSVESPPVMLANKFGFINIIYMFREFRIYKFGFISNLSSMLSKNVSSVNRIPLHVISYVSFVFRLYLKQPSVSVFRIQTLKVTFLLHRRRNVVYNWVGHSDRCLQLGLSRASSSFKVNILRSSGTFSFHLLFCLPTDRLPSAGCWHATLKGLALHILTGVHVGACVFTRF